MDKRPGALAKALTDILVLQKQVTVGLPPKPREKVIDSPLTPDQLADLIQEACGEDSLMIVMTQVRMFFYVNQTRFRFNELASCDNVLGLGGG